MAQYENIRRIYLDLDDVVFRSSPCIQKHVSKNFPQFSTEILRLKEGNLLLWKKCLELALLEINKAKREEREPELFLPFPVGKNDIIREVRDATLEADGKKSNGVIPYDEIYSEENWMPYAKENINDLYKVFGSERLCCLTAHNGLDDTHGREFDAKVDAVHRMNPNIKVYGLRFHPYEHKDDGKRRPRNLKSSAIRRIEQITDDDPIKLIVCPDDSSFNNKDIYDNGGIPVFINHIGAPNERGYAMAKSIRAESLFREFDALHLNGPRNQVLRKIITRK